jgi:hypothetical protein
LKDYGINEDSVISIIPNRNKDKEREESNEEIESLAYNFSATTALDTISSLWGTATTLIQGVAPAALITTTVSVVAGLACRESNFFIR